MGAQERERERETDRQSERKRERLQTPGSRDLQNGQRLAKTGERESRGFKDAKTNGKMKGEQREQRHSPHSSGESLSNHHAKNTVG